ncbi:MAG: carboxypeptidase regulatory-like domain-containing protein [Planctomycetes bacterium]|nr:carboxypeptidase regulatory-like domain-containing protein [Planctomycetota bacterium]
MKMRKSTQFSLSLCTLALASLIGLQLWDIGPAHAPEALGRLPDRDLPAPQSDRLPEHDHASEQRLPSDSSGALNPPGVYCVAVNSSGQSVPGEELRVYSWPSTGTPIHVTTSHIKNPTYLGDLPTGRYVVRSARGELVFFRHTSGSQSWVKLLMTGIDVQGVVLDPDGTPFTGALIAMEQQGDNSLWTVGESGQDGSFMVPSVQSGARLVALASGRQASPSVAVASAPEASIVLRLGDKVGSLRVRVVDAYSGESLDGWCSCQFLSHSSEHTSKQVIERRVEKSGGCCMDSLPIGPVHLVLRSAGYAPSTLSCRVGSIGEQEVVVRLVRGATISVEVKNSSGDPVKSAFVTTSGDSRMSHALTDVEGRTVLGGVPPGAITVFATSGGREGNADVKVEDRQEAFCMVTLPGNAKIAGRCVDEHGRTLPNVRIRMEPLAAGRAGELSLLTDENGAFEANHVLDGRYRIHAFCGDAAMLPALTKEVNLRDGPIVLVIPEGKRRTGRLVGRFQDKDSAVARVRISAIRGEQSPFDIETTGTLLACDGEGCFAADNVPPGEYSIAVEVHDSGLMPLASARVTAGDTIDVGVLSRSTFGSCLFEIDGRMPDSYAGITLKSGSVAIPLRREGIVFSADNVPVGRYQAVTSGDLPPFRREVIVSSGAQVKESLSVRNALGHKLSISVPAIDGERRFRLSIRSASGERLRAMEWSQGGSATAATSLVLEPKFYRVVIESMDGCVGECIIDGSDKSRTHHVEMY